MIHINTPRGYYIGQVRKHGHRLYETVTEHHATPELAMSEAALNMKGMKRARVLFIDCSGWYEPNVIIEASR